MELNLLRSFDAVVRCGSFTRAAEQLYLSQPTVSTHIRTLEEKLGCQLIQRTTKSITVTPRGREVWEYVSDMLKLWDRAEAACRDEERRILHLGASTIPSAYILPEILPEFGRLCPNVYFVIHQSDSQGVLDGLADGLFDIGLVGMRPQAAPLACQSFYQDRMVLVTPVADRFLAMQRLEETPVRELLREPVILRERGSGTGKSATGYLESIGVSEGELNVAARVNDQEAVKNLVAGGLGVSIISGKAAERFVREKRLLQFELPNAAARKFYLVWRKGAGLSDSIRRFRDFAVEKYAAEQG